MPSHLPTLTKCESARYDVNPAVGQSLGGYKNPPLVFFFTIETVILMVFASVSVMYLEHHHGFS